jgi:uncharacterized membrane protein required for colicin V production
LNLNVYDILFVALPVALFLLGYVRGAWRELLSLAGAGAGAVLAGRYHQALATTLSALITDRDFAALLSFVLILLAGYLAGGFLGGVVDQRTRGHAPSGGERLLAAFFGGCKGGVLDLAVYWIVLAYIPAFQPDLKASRVALAVGQLLDLLARHNPLA